MMDDMQDEQDATIDEPSCLIVTPASVERKAPLHELTCRPTNDVGRQRAQRRQYVMSSVQEIPSTINGNAPLDMVDVMHLWNRFVRRTHQACSAKFWEFFLSMHDQAAVAIDAALIAVKKTFMDRDKDLEAWKQFPPSRALLLQRIDGQFWTHVRHTIRIDLQPLHLPEGSISFLEFTFVDPVFAWIIAARRQRADDMHWRPIRSTNESGNILTDC